MKHKEHNCNIIHNRLFSTNISWSCYLLQYFILSFPLPLSFPFLLFPYSSFFPFSPLLLPFPFHISILFLKRLEDLLASFFFARNNFFPLYVKMLSFLLLCMKVILHYAKLSVVLWVLTILGKICWKLHIGWCSVSVPCLTKWLHYSCLMQHLVEQLQRHLLWCQVEYSMYKSWKREKQGRKV